MNAISVTLWNDQSQTQSTMIAAAPLVALFSYAHQWALQENRADPCTLTFSSVLAAMTAGKDPLCRWLQSHLALRGVRRESMTKGRAFDPQPLPDVLNTTYSFRQALAKARELNPNEATHGLSVRHFMAAYAAIPSYHLDDFLRLRIDRRAWCIELGEQLAQRFPDEKAMWLDYARAANPIPSLGFNTDAPEGRDLLNVDREVEAFARLIASRNSATPLSVGVFGAWGSGKSFFMRRLRKRVASFAKLGHDEGRQSKYHGQIAQIDFNAWHYSEGNLAASFVDHILRNLCVQPNETAEVLRARSEAIIKQLDSARQDLEVRQKAVAEAEAKSAQARQTLDELNARIAGEIEGKKAEVAAAQNNLQAAQGKLRVELENLQNDIQSATHRAPAKAAANRLLERLNNPEISQALTNVRTLIERVQAAYTKRRLLFYGMIVLAIGAIATTVKQTNFYVQLTTVITAVGGLAAMAAPWLMKLEGLARDGKAFEEEVNRIKEMAVEEINRAHGESISELQTAVAARIATVNDLSAQLKQLAEAPATARLAIEELEKQRGVALTQQAEAAAVVEAKRAELAKLTTGTLLEEFLNERLSSEGYLKELTIFSRIRNDFERLSTLMTQANKEYVNPGDGKIVKPPVVSRIVLYIDDLDRCPTDRVIEVLKLVHLLLAFPLFVCVAAVDPRWITRCLEKAPGLLNDAGKSDLNIEVGVPATAADYLEKIFQIPLWLRPVPSEQRGAIARTLLDPSQSLEDSQFDLMGAPLPEMVATDSAIPEEREGREDETARAAPIDPDLISEAELQYLDRLSGLLDGNPRSLKRFVNTYRLVKTALSDVELAVFLKQLPTRPKDKPKYAPFRICMGQLAVLCTQRNRALKLVQFADQTTENLSFTGWLNGFEKVDRALANCFRESFSEDLEGLDLNTFKLWLERTRRYSFYL